METGAAVTAVTGRCSRRAAAAVTNTIATAEAAVAATGNMEEEGEH